MASFYNSMAGSWSPASCCAQLSSSLGSLVSYSGDYYYNISQASYWSIQESSLVPACVVTPRQSQDVADVLSILSDPSNAACKFAIKGQTHAPAAGFANIDGGVTIDMTGLNSTQLSSDKSTLKVGAGAAWIEVYRYLNEESVMVAGGRNGAVGLGGLLLGGGISHFTTKVGFACDNVVNYEVVLSSGILTNVNATSHPDLYLALKGGATNFGVVTAFDLATFPQGQISVNTIANPISQRTAIFDAFTNITASPQFNPNVSLVSSMIYNSTSKSWIMSSSAVYTQPVPHPAVFQQLLSIPNLSNKTSITNLSTYAAEAATPPLNWLFWTGTYTASSTLMSQIFDSLNSTLYSFDVPGGVVWSITYEPLPSIIPAISRSKGGNVLGLSPDDGDSFIMLISALWPSPSSNTAIEATARKAGQLVDAVASSTGWLRRFKYLNYADSSQRPLHSYGAKNLAYLRAMSVKYDPRGVFQRQVPGGFKL